MTNPGQMARLQKFASSDQTRSISTVAVKDGVGYATDGRLLVSETMDEPCEDIVKRDDEKIVPVDSMIKFSKYPELARKWYRFPQMAFESFSTVFKEALRVKIAENDRDYADRYKRVVCPSCNDDLYWDTLDEKLVSEREAKDCVEFKDVNVPIRMEFPRDGFLDVDFCYLFSVSQEYRDVLYSKAIVADQNNATLLFMKTEDGKMKAVLMPLRTNDSEFICGRFVVMEEESA